MKMSAGALAGVLIVTGIASSVLFVADEEPRQGEATTIDVPVTIASEDNSSDSGGRAPPESSGLPASLEDAVTATADIDWLRKYHESTDDFALAHELGQAAMNGNSRAQYLLGEVLLRCEVLERALAPYSEGTVAERVERHLASQPHGLEHNRSKFRREALRCEKLFFENPLAEYDLPEEANDFRYWSRLAVASQDPIAIMDRAFQTVANSPATRDAEQDRVFQEALLADVRIAVTSGDPTALFKVGGLLSYPSVGATAEQGYAWQVAACEAGYDCSLVNPDWGFDCVASGACLAGETWLDTLQRDLGAAKYAEIYAQAQDIQYKIKAGDWDGLQQYIKIQ
jgi:hypothetical protein